MQMRYTIEGTDRHNIRFTIEGFVEGRSPTDAEALQRAACVPLERAQEAGHLGPYKVTRFVLEVC
jgi:hypothetical protein